MGKLAKRFFSDYLRVDKELIIVLLLVSITAIIFFFVSNQRAFLNFFYLPVLLGAFFYGKRYAALAAIFSIILVGIVAYTYPETFVLKSKGKLYRWLDIGTWGGFMLVTSYLMGHLYEKKEQTSREIKRTYEGIIEMLSLIIDAVDQQTQSHSYRVSVIAERLARQVGCSPDEVENIRIAALLHDLGKIGVSKEILEKVGRLSEDEREHMKTHTKNAVGILEPVGGKVLELLPLILNHHESYDGSGYNAMIGDRIPIGARIIAVADVYDALTSDRPYRKALAPSQAKTEIITNSGIQFDPYVVKAFEVVFPEMESDSHLFALKLGH